MPNSFSAVGHIYIPGFYTGQILLKKFNQARLYSSGPQTFLSAGTGNQPRHYLEITISSGNDLRKSCDVARNGADLQKKKVITSLAVTCNVTRDSELKTGRAFRVGFGLKF